MIDNKIIINTQADYQMYFLAMIDNEIIIKTQADISNVFPCNDR